MYLSPPKKGKAINNSGPKFWFNYLKNWPDFINLYQRNKRRNKVWAKTYQRYLDSQNQLPPRPTVLQLIPTEACNLRCKMCNQWGENGYLLNKLRQVTHIDFQRFSRFMDNFRQYNPDFLFSIHGGEPFCYREMDALIDYIGQNRIDTMFTTNGTLLDKFAEPLSKINSHTTYILSLDGGEAVNDKIRGKGTTRKIINSIQALTEACLKNNQGLPKLIINYCVNEHNLDDIDNLEPLARSLNAAVINFNLRWFLPSEKGEEYNRILKNRYKIQPSNAWTGWVTDSDFNGIKPVIEKIWEKQKNWRNQLAPPYYEILPRGLNKQQYIDFYLNYEELFGKSSCVMPSYMVRIHSTGEMIYCPGHPDIIPGNVLENDFETIYHNQLSTRFRKNMEKELMPICNRCCGLYMTYSGTKFL